jgi:hypothetical protein
MTTHVLHYQYDPDYWEPGWPTEKMYRPKLNVILVNELTGKNSGSELNCLIDTGADICRFPASLERELGFDPQSTPTYEGNGANDTTIKYRKYNVTVRFVLDEQPYTIPLLAAFSEGDNQPGLLGLNGIFDHFQNISFDHANKTITFTDRGLI